MSERIGWLLYDPMDIPRNEVFIAELIKYAQLHGISMKLLSTQAQMPGECPELLLNRSRDAGWSKRLEGRGVRVINRAAVTEITNDKMLTYRFLHERHGIPMAKTDWYDAETACHLTMPLVAKAADGHGGKDVMWISDEAALRRAAASLPRPFLLQQPMVTGWDVRVYVLGGEIYSAVLRTSDCDFRSNFSLGGAVSVYTPDAEMQEMVRRVCTVLPLDFAGIDFLRHPDGGYVIGEIEDAVGCRMLYHLTDHNPAADYIRYAADTISK